jgi:glutathionylspermidine synthase
MRRREIAPREDWRAKVEALGLTWHSLRGQAYWDEAACYVFTLAEIEEIEAATAELYRLFVAAGAHVIAKRRYAEFGLPSWTWRLIEQSWEEEPPALNHGRVDLGYRGDGPPKLFEFNCDTPTALLEAAVVQWAWKEEAAPDLDQYNSLHDCLVARWKEIAPQLPGHVHFTRAADDEGEDAITTAYFCDLAAEAGLASTQILAGDIGWHAGRKSFVDLAERDMAAIFHLYPWDWLTKEALGPRIPEARATLWLEPIWKMLWNSKAILPVLHELFPDHPNMLGARRTPPSLDTFVRKPVFSREGANVEIVRDNRIVEATGGDYGQEGYVYQELYDLPCMGGAYPVGAWIVDGEPCGLGIREGSLITGASARFVPHVIEV